MTAPVLPLTGFYQFGYVTRDLDAAAETLRRQFGIKHYRRKFSAPWMESIHAWAGDSQVEVIRLGEGAPEMYADYVPEKAGELRLQHLGYRIDTLEKWNLLREAITAGGFATPLDSVVMDGNLRAVYVDTRALLGIYSEYVYFSGPALNTYDDVPHND